MQVDVAGPGFINFKFTPAFLLAWLRRYRDESAFRDGAGGLYRGHTLVADYPSPNVAKQMHVGHLRPMVIGEAISRLLAFCGAHVIRDNHLGDWGTNFGVLILELKESGETARRRPGGRRSPSSTASTKLARPRRRTKTAPGPTPPARNW